MDTIIFLHGRGLGPGSAEDIRSAFPGGRIVAPTGGVALKHGHTWFENIRTGIARPESVHVAERRLLDWLDEELRAADRPWLSGFSNGGALAAHMLIRHPGRFRGAALFAAPLVLPPWPADALAGKPVFYAHGDDADTVVDQHFYEEARAYLEKPSGCRPAVRRYNAGHVVDPAMIRDCSEWFAVEGDSAGGSGALAAH